MSKIAKISTIPKKYSVGKTFEYALQQQGWTRVPGTGVTLFPFRENDGSYRTALDPNSVIYQSIGDSVVKKSKMEWAEREKERLEKATQLRLDGNSPYYNYGFAGRENGQSAKTVNPFKLLDGDNIFDMSDPMQAVTFYWLSVHPKIASTLEAYNNGDYGPDCTYYVKDEEAEAEQIYAIKKEFNTAIKRFDAFSLDKRRKVARLLDLPVTDDTKEELVYNMVDEFLNKKEVDKGPYKGQSSLRVFTTLADLDDHSLYVKDLIEQALRNQILTIRKGKVFEGQQEIHRSKDELTDSLLDDKNQEDVLALEKKLKLKKLASV